MKKNKQNVENIREFYDKNYLEEKFPYGLKPNSIIKKLLRYVSAGVVLDLGAGYGKDSLFLAAKGFKVFAIDASPVAASQLKMLAQKSKLKIKAKAGNLMDFRSWPRNVKVFIDIYTMHHFSEKEGHRYLNKIQTSTPKGGLNVIKAMMKKGSLYAKNRRIKRQSFMIGKGELIKLYKSW